jgi:hypothetical protein
MNLTYMWVVNGIDLLTYLLQWHDDINIDIDIQQQ